MKVPISILIPIKNEAANDNVKSRKQKFRK
jgi:hypothetical protein